MEQVCLTLETKRYKKFSLYVIQITCASLSSTVFLKNADSPSLLIQQPQHVAKEPSFFRS